MRSANLLRKRLHSSAMPPVVVKTKGVKVPFSTSKTLFNNNNNNINNNNNSVAIFAHIYVYIPIIYNVPSQFQNVIMVAVFSYFERESNVCRIDI